MTGEKQSTDMSEEDATGWNSRTPQESSHPGREEEEPTRVGECIEIYGRYTTVESLYM